MTQDSLSLENPNLFVKLFLVVSFLILFYYGKKFKKNAKANELLSISERRYTVMNALFRLTAVDQKEGTPKFRCVVSNEDLSTSVQYWLDHGCKVFIEKF